jgi:dCTP deaminase
LVLGWTKERVHLKSSARVAARVEGKSSLARLGLAVHVTAPTIHSGFNGQIQLEIINLGPLPIRLRADMAICQLIFEQTLGFPEKGYGGQFHGQGSH